MYFPGTYTYNVQESVQDDLQSIFHWMCKNMFSLNTVKTVYLLLGSRYLITKPGRELLYHVNPNFASPMEEVCGSQGRLCWKMSHIWSNSTIAS